MVGAVLVQNTAWTNVEKSIKKLKQKNVLHAEKIIELSHDSLATLIRSSGYYNVKAKRLKNFCEWYVRQGGYEKLIKLSSQELRNNILQVNGIGFETADDILLYAFHHAYFVVDAYTRRLFTRLKLLKQNLVGYEDIRQFIEENLKNNDVKLYQEFHALIVYHAKTICRSKPLCDKCIFNDKCQYLAS